MDVYKFTNRIGYKRSINPDRLGVNILQLQRYWIIDGLVIMECLVGICELWYIPRGLFFSIAEITLGQLKIKLILLEFSVNWSLSLLSTRPGQWAAHERIFERPAHLERPWSWAWVLMSMLNTLKSGYHFALFNVSNFDCTVSKLLTMTNYQNYYFYFTIKYIYIYIYTTVVLLFYCCFSLIV